MSTALTVEDAKSEYQVYSSQGLILSPDKSSPGDKLPLRKILGKSSESVQCAMAKACDACADMGQL